MADYQTGATFKCDVCGRTVPAPTDCSSEDFSPGGRSTRTESGRYRDLEAERTELVEQDVAQIFRNAFKGTNAVDLKMQGG